MTNSLNKLGFIVPNLDKVQSIPLVAGFNQRNNPDLIAKLEAREAREAAKVIDELSAWLDAE